MRNPGDRPSAETYWTSGQAARAFHVGVSTIKRWTDEGELESVRTLGGHRRYTAAALRRFAAIRGLGFASTPGETRPSASPGLSVPAGLSLFDALASGHAEAVRQLVTPPFDALAKRAAFFDRVVGEALREVGNRWERGELGVDQEHRASHLLAEAIDRLRDRSRAAGPLAVLACPPDEWHDLPLRLVRLLLEWRGWRTEMLGAALPWPAAQEVVLRTAPALLALSSRTGEPFQSEEFDILVERCRQRGTAVIVGGEWARGGGGRSDRYLRFRSLRGFERWLRQQ